MSVAQYEATAQRGDTAALWRNRIQAARNHRKRFEPGWLEAQFFAAGKQWLEYNPQSNRFRVLKTNDPRVQRRTHDVLTQYLWTIMGALGQGNDRPEFLFEKSDTEAEDVADFLNDALSYGWDSEFHGDAVLQKIRLNMVVYGPAFGRCRFDRSKGAILMAEMPHKDGQPIWDPAQRSAHMEQSYMTGTPVDIRPAREGMIVWEAGSPWNRLPPPGIEESRNFPWDIIVRPVHIDEVRSTYGAGAAVKPEPVDSLDVLGMSDDPSGGGAAKVLDDHVLVYTCFQMPSDREPDGVTAILAGHTLLDVSRKLPYPDCQGCETGVVDFGYWPVPGQFWHRGFLSAGIEPQKGLNKRETQIDEWIDRSMPWVAVSERQLRKFKPPRGQVMELVPYDDAHPIPQQQSPAGPGQWLIQDAGRRKEAVADALGVKAIALGENPTGVTTYSQLASLRETEATKLGPVSAAFRLGVSSLATVTVQAMKRWPPGKKMMIADDEGQIKLLQWDASKVPEDFLARPSSTAAQPSGLGAELAKINDLWQAAQIAGLVMQKPREWFDWYRKSMQAGKALDPPDDSIFEQRHMAALENAAMAHSGQPVSVRPTDNHALHLPEHEEQATQLEEALTMGDQSVVPALQAIEQHIAEHQAFLAQSQAPAALPPQLSGQSASSQQQITPPVQPVTPVPPTPMG